jgi:predicted Zn-ribbon and HTH transcriptional regulator
MAATLTATYARKPFYVEAVRVTKENMAEVSAWCGGEIRINRHNTTYIFVRVIRPIKETQCMAFVGDWVLGAGSSYKVYKDRAFREAFEPSSGKKELLEGPHCRACGIGDHPHGERCHSNCPTCGSDANPIHKAA